MIVHDVEQGSPEWDALRVGIPTVSQFGRIIQPVRMQYSTGARSLIAELIAERRLGHAVESASSGWMMRGSDLENEAINWYQFEREVDVERVGFITNDAGDEGGSPDGLVGEDGGLEVKCLAAKHHMECLLGLDTPAPRTQVQGYLRLTDRKWWDVLGYNPHLPPVLIRVHRDQAFIDALDECLKKFKEELWKAEERLDEMGERGRIDGDDLLSQLQATIDNGGVFEAKEMLVVRETLAKAVDRGVFDDADVATILADAERGEWDEVRAMCSHAERALSVEAV